MSPTIDTRTLVVHTGGIGDFLLFCPSLLRIREEGPVVLAGYRERLNLAVISDIATDAHHLDDIGFDSLFAESNERLRRFLGQFDRAIVWMNDDGAIRNGLERCGVPEIQIYPGLPPKDWQRHASEYYAEQLGLGNLPPFRLPIEPGDDPHDVVIHPGSGGARKNWPLDRYRELAQRLTEAGRTVEWVRGPAEEDLRLPADARLVDTSVVVSLARELGSTGLHRQRQRRDASGCSLRMPNRGDLRPDRPDDLGAARRECCRGPGPSLAGSGGRDGGYGSYGSHERVARFTLLGVEILNPGSQSRRGFQPRLLFLVRLR